MIGNRNLLSNEKKLLFIPVLALYWLDDIGSLIHIKLRKKQVDPRLIF